MSARVAVVGGGLAGLSAALRLASRGVETVLLERSPTLGGKAGEVREAGYRFDTGPTVVTLPQVIAATFDDAPGCAPPGMTPLDPLARYRLPSGRWWDVWRDPERSAAGLPHGQAPVYRTLLEEARQLYRGAADTFVHGPKPGLLALARYALGPGRRAHPRLSMAELVERSGADPDLAAFFLRFATYAGADPYRAPAVLLNIAWAELGIGAVHVEGGVAALVRRLAAAASGAGARLRTGAEVEGLVQDGGRVRAVRVDGGTLEVDGVVAAVDRQRTLAWLGRRVAPEPRPSLSGFVLLLGVEGREPAGAHHSVLFPADYPAEFADLRRGRLPADPTLYLNVSARSEPADAPPGHENWFVMANAPALDDAGADPLAAALPAVVRPAAGALDDLRAVDGAATPAERAYAAHLLALLERRAGLRPERVRWMRLVGPRQLARSGFRGSIYGAAPEGLLGALRPAPRVRGVANLALAGGTVHPGGGIPLVLLSGRNAADALRAQLPREATSNGGATGRG